MKKPRIWLACPQELAEPTLISVFGEEKYRQMVAEFKANTPRPPHNTWLKWLMFLATKSPEDVKKHLTSLKR